MKKGVLENQIEKIIFKVYQYQRIINKKKLYDSLWNK